MAVVNGYQLTADWSGDGDYSDTLEDVTSPYLAGDVVISYGRDQAQTQAPTAATKMTFQLDNPTRAFSPENTGSAIAGKVIPGVETRFQKDAITLFEGPIAEFDVDTDPARKLFSATCLDGWGGEKLSTPLYQGLRTGDAINLILDEIGWTGPRDIDPGATWIGFWWAEDETAANAVEKLVDSEGPPSIAFVERGTFVFHDRHHRHLNASSLTSQETFSHAVPEGTSPVGSLKIARGAGYDHGLLDVVNEATFLVEERHLAAVGEVWSTQDSFALTEGEIIEIAAESTDPFLNAVTPVADIDYVPAVGTVEVWLSRDSGRSTTILVKAVGGPATVAGMALRGSPVPVVRTHKVFVEDSTSITKYRGRRPWQRTVPWCNRHDAKAIAEIVVGAYADNRPTVTFTISNIGAAYLTEVKARRISDRITYKNDELGLNRDFFVERLEHTVRKLGAVDHSLTYWCQAAGPDQPSNVFTFDVAGKGFNDGNFGQIGVDNPANMFMFDGGSGHRFNEGVFST